MELPSTSRKRMLLLLARVITHYRTMHYKPFHHQISSQVNIMNVKVDTFVIYSPSHRLTGIVCHHNVRPVNKPIEHAQELCKQNAHGRGGVAK